ncbi:MAG: hypothetical protein VW338_15015 [Rhodospirillaceae bacterium]
MTPTESKRGGGRFPVLAAVAWAWVAVMMVWYLYQFRAIAKAVLAMLPFGA